MSFRLEARFPFLDSAQHAFAGGAGICVRRPSLGNVSPSRTAHKIFSFPRFPSGGSVVTPYDWSFRLYSGSWVLHLFRLGRHPVHRLSLENAGNDFGIRFLFLLCHAGLFSMSGAPFFSGGRWSWPVRTVLRKDFFSFFVDVTAQCPRSQHFFLSSSFLLPPPSVLSTDFTQVDLAMIGFPSAAASVLSSARGSVPGPPRRVDSVTFRP